MARPYAEISYTLRGLVIASYNINANTYGTPELLDDGQMFVSEPEHDTDQMRGYGRKTRGLSVPVGAKITFKAGGVDTSGMIITCGATITESGSSPNRVKKVQIKGNKSLPYFGVIGEAVTDDGGYAVIGLQAVMLNTVPKYTMDGEANKFNIMETEGYAFIVANDLLESMKLYELASDFTRPTTGSDFLNFFA